MRTWRVHVISCDVETGDGRRIRLEFWNNDNPHEAPEGVEIREIEDRVLCAVPAIDDLAPLVLASSTSFAGGPNVCTHPRSEWEWTTRATTRQATCGVCRQPRTAIVPLESLAHDDKNRGIYTNEELLLALNAFRRLDGEAPLDELPEIPMREPSSLSFGSRGAIDASLFGE